MQPSPQHVVPMRTVLSHILTPILMGLVMALAYFGGFHRPAPHGVPVAVVGAVDQAGAVGARIQQATGDRLSVTTVPDVAAAEKALRSLDITAAYVPGAHPTLLTASAASDSSASVVTRIFTAVAAAQGAPLTLRDVVPVGPEDPIGQNAFFFLVALSVASYATAIAIGAAGATRTVRERVGLAVGACVVIATALMTVASVLFGMFPGHGLAMWGLSLVYSLAVLLVGVGLHPIVGRWCTLLYSAAFVAFNFTSSGGIFRPELQPGLFGWLHEFWIGAGFVDAARGITSFPGVSIAHALWILAGWVALGVLCVGLGALHERRVAALGAAPAPLTRLGSTRRHGAGLTRDEETQIELEEDVAV